MSDSHKVRGLTVALSAPVLFLFALSGSIAACGSPSIAPTGSSSGTGGAAASAAAGGGAAASSGTAAGGGTAASSGTAGQGGASPDGGPGPGAPVKKRGIAYGYNSQADLLALKAGIGWWYNWSLTPDQGVGPNFAQLGVDFAPMVWGGKFVKTDVVTHIPPGVSYLLTFNEPNFGSQSNLTPAAAAALWPDIEWIAQQKGLKIVSPAVNYCGGNCTETDPFVWLDKFFAACNGCKVDAVAMHWYACTKEALTWYLGQYKAKYKQPLWLTEFACLDDPTITEAKEEQYMKDALAILEADPSVERYAWFTGRFMQQPAINLLGAASGTLTPLGQIYVKFP